MLFTSIVNLDFSLNMYGCDDPKSSQTSDGLSNLRRSVQVLTMKKSAWVWPVVFQVVGTSSSGSRLCRLRTRLRNRRLDSRTRDGRHWRTSWSSRRRRRLRPHQIQPWKHALWASATATWRMSRAEWTSCCWSCWTPDFRPAGRTLRMRTRGTGSASDTDSRRAVVADSDDESQGHDACMDRLDRSRARIDRSACALRAAHTCPRT